MIDQKCASGVSHRNKKLKKKKKNINLQPSIEQSGPEFMPHHA